LLNHGYRVMNVDTVAPAKQVCHFMKTDLNELGQAIDTLMSAADTIDRSGIAIGELSAAAHLAGIASLGSQSAGSAKYCPTTDRSPSALTQYKRRPTRGPPVGRQRSF